MSAFPAAASYFFGLKRTRGPKQSTPSEHLRGVQQDSDGAGVGEFDVHHLLESTGFAFEARSSDAPDEIVVKLAGAFGTSGGVE